MALAELFGAESSERIAFTANSTQALNTAIKGTLSLGDHVITTALEHNSVLRPLYELEERGTELTILPADPMGNICYEDIGKAIRPNTKAIVTTHGSNLTGNLLDIQRIGSIARKHGLTYIVDASQTAGVFDIDVRKMHIDILCFTGHKGLLGPQGTGGLYVREGVSVRPLLSGGSGVQTYLKQHPPQMPTALEAGTLNGHGIAGLGAAVRYLQETGLPAIRQKEQELMRAFYTQVRQILQGGYDAAYAAGAIITGGHTIKGAEPIYGLAVSGFVDPQKVLTNSNAKPGDVLILTKPLGVGILTTGAKADMVDGAVMDRIYTQMATLNKTARDIMVQYPVHSCTDVTGFGLMGHSFEMAQGILRNVKKITDLVSRGEIIALVETENGTVPVEASLDGILRGLIRDGYPVTAGFKIADIDPRAEELDNCFTISNKARCIVGGVLEALLQRKGELGL